MEVGPAAVGVTTPTFGAPIPALTPPSNEASCADIGVSIQAALVSLRTFPDQPPPVVQAAMVRNRRNGRTFG